MSTDAIKHTLIIACVSLVTLTAATWFLKPPKGQSVFQNKSTNWNWSDRWTDAPSSPPPQQVQPQIQPPPIQVPPQNQVTEEPKNYEHALKISAQVNKPVLVIFGAPWCKYCKQLKMETLPNPNVQQAIEQYVFIEVNKDLHPQIARKLGVGNIPAYLIVTSNEQILKRGEGFKNPTEFLTWLNQ